MVTEYFPQRSLEHNTHKYEGKPALALKAFRSLVETVARLHDEGVVHRDIKPANVFVGNHDELILGDFGIVFLPNQPNRLTRTNESVGPHDYMPPWSDVGGRLENVQPNFDVYMLGKLLWCMVSGRLLLQREWFDRPDNDISLMFRDDPHAYMINVILGKCVVEDPKQCLSSARDLLLIVDTYLSVIDRGGQLLKDGVPRPCHVCGYGFYERLPLQMNSQGHVLRLWRVGTG
ncbi:MAG: protein kinase domain-containing protein [Candidatus Korobacteraceae bacterium]